MTPWNRAELPLYMKCLIKVLKRGPIPKHIAVAFDGCRRYAELKKFPNLYDGVFMKIDIEKELCNLCYELGCEEVSIFSTSINSILRPPEENIDLYRICYDELLVPLLNRMDEFNKMGVQIRILGNLTLLPRRMRKILAEIALKAKPGHKMIINYAFAHSTRDEITTSIKMNLSAVEKKIIDISDIDENFIEVGLPTNGSSDIDLFIRTSGISRTSDFVSWQSLSAVRFVLDLLGPEMNIYNFIKAILHYQKCMKDKEYTSFREDFRKQVYDEKTLIIKDYCDDQRKLLLKQILSE